MGFTSVFLFCIKKIAWFIWGKKKISSLYRDELQFFTCFIWRKAFFPRFFAIY